MAERVRTFIAIELPQPVQQGLAQVQGRLKRGHPPVRWVAPDKVHLTLKFLGEIPIEQLEVVGQVADRVAATAAPFELEAVGIGCFPNLQRPRVVWVGIEGDLELLRVFHGRLEEGLAHAGFPPEGRPFSPHLTLGRVQRRARPAEIRALGQAVAALDVLSLGRWHVGEITVMRSDLRPEGPIYTAQRVVPLGGV